MTSNNVEIEKDNTYVTDANGWEDDDGDCIDTIMVGTPDEELHSTTSTVKQNTSTSTNVNTSSISTALLSLPVVLKVQQQTKTTDIENNANVQNTTHIMKHFVYDPVTGIIALRKRWRNPISGSRSILPVQLHSSMIK
jgi:hypothetical protein